MLITRFATVAGITVASLAFTTTVQLINLIGSGTSLLTTLTTEIIGIGSTYLLGSIAGYTAKLIVKSIVKIPEDQLQKNAMLIATVVGAVAGVGTVITISVGGYLITYTIDYAGTLSSSVLNTIIEYALKISSNINHQHTETETIGDLYENHFPPNLALTEGKMQEPA